MKKKFYVTTAIDYVNAEPHIGHAYQKIVADALARWHKLLGEDVLFVTGTDEHGRKVQKAAKKANLPPKRFVDEVSSKFKEAWKILNILPDRFIRTTDKDHTSVVSEFIKKCEKAGDIYKGEYSGLYCTDCEAYYTEREAQNKNCPIHNKPLEKIKEESYFFKLSKYQDFLLKLYKENPSFILPKERRNEIVCRVKEGLKDLSISRTKKTLNWGIPFPLDKDHVVYVWFDALINYYTATQTPSSRKKFWPAYLHILGKDNTWFHTVYWPAMLKSAGIELPKSTFNHGFLKFNGQKISKSLGNAISPKILAEKYGSDTVRYFALRQFPFATGEDGDFSEKALIDRHNNELANKLGNLVSRVSTLAEKYGIEKCENELLEKNLTKFARAPKVDKHNKSFKNSRLEKIKHNLENYELDKALNEIFYFIDVCNEYVQKTQPWKSKDKKVLYELSDSIKAITILLSPFLPETSEKIAKIFNFKISLAELNKPLKVSKIKKSEILFKKI